MQIISPGTHSFRSWTVAEGLSKEATERLGKLESFEKLRAEGCRSATALDVLGWSRATCYRQRGVRGLESKSRRPHPEEAGEPQPGQALPVLPADASSPASAGTSAPDMRSAGPGMAGRPDLAGWCRSTT